MCSYSLFVCQAGFSPSVTVNDEVDKFMVRASLYYIEVCDECDGGLRFHSVRQDGRAGGRKR